MVSKKPWAQVAQVWVWAQIFGPRYGFKSKMLGVGLVWTWYLGLTLKSELYARSFQDIIRHGKIGFGQGYWNYKF